MCSSFMLGDREILSIVSPETHQTIMYRERGEYYCMMTVGSELSLKEMEFTPSTHLPKSELFPRASDTFPPTVASSTLEPNSFVKIIGITSYKPGDTTYLEMTTRHLEHEVATFETLKHHPHPNICEYRGCLVDEGFVTGIVLKEYPEDLSYCREKVNRQMVMRDIGAAIQHLHSLGIIHNDVNPGNIILPADLSRAVLIDFDSSRPEGYKFCDSDRRYTEGFSKEELDISEKENDLYGLERIRLWLEDPRLVGEDE
ncbi:hypothetical protein P7C70_g5667, partial [Phenoliferia sp. Uapishka_3]